MWIRPIGLLMILVGFALAYFGWRSSGQIQEIEDEEEWEDAVYGGAGDLGGLSMVVGAGMILFGGLLALRVL
jgi:hypothetical protein